MSRSCMKFHKWDVKMINKLKLQHVTLSDSTEFMHSFIEVNNQNIAIVMDCDNGGRSCALSMERIVKMIGAGKMLFRDAIGYWDFYSAETGFVVLADEDPCLELEDAIRNAEMRVII